MNRQKRNKGEYAYPAYEKKRVILRTVIYFAISLAVFQLKQKKICLRLSQCLGFCLPAKALCP